MSTREFLIFANHKLACDVYGESSAPSLTNRVCKAWINTSDRSDLLRTNVQDGHLWLFHKSNCTTLVEVL